jgi:hypothetical protein
MYMYITLYNYSHNHLSPYISLYHLVSPVHFMPSSKLSSHPPCVRPFSSKAGRKSMVSLIPAAMPRLGSRRSCELLSWIFLASWHPVKILQLGSTSWEASPMLRGKDLQQSSASSSNSNWGASGSFKRKGFVWLCVVRTQYFKHL